MERTINKGSLADEWVCELDEIDLGLSEWKDGDKTFNYLAIGLEFPFEDESCTYIVHLYELKYCELDDVIKYHLKKIHTSGHNMKAILKDYEANNYVDNYKYSGITNHNDFLHDFVKFAVLRQASDSNLCKITYLTYKDEQFYKILNNSYIDW